MMTVCIPVTVLKRDTGFSLTAAGRSARWSALNFTDARSTALYGKMMAYAAQRTLTRWDPQVILPVPMYRKKEKKRGYNQAAILARETGKCLHIPVRGIWCGEYGIRNRKKI